MDVLGNLLCLGRPFSDMSPLGELVIKEDSQLVECWLFCAGGRGNRLHCQRVVYYQIQCVLMLFPSKVNHLQLFWCEGDSVLVPL